jgi:DNA-binding MarR family transcriptional regulator
VPAPRSTSPSPSPELRDAAGELRATLSLLYRRIRQTRVPGELSPSEGSVLTRLDHQGPATGAQLARLEQVSPQSIAATLHGLEARGLIARAPDPADGRRIILSLTAAGRDVVHSKRSARDEQLAQALAALSPRERGQLLATLPLLERLAAEL